MSGGTGSQLYDSRTSRYEGPCYNPHQRYRLLSSPDRHGPNEVTVTFLSGVGFGALAFTWPFGSWQNSAKFLAALLITYIIVLWISAVIWTFRDIHDRTRDPFFQAIAVFVVLVFNLPGLWLYLILRPSQTLNEAYARSLEEEALLQELEDQKACPNCRRRVADDFLICPTCETQLKEACAVCSKPLAYSWTACPFCGTSKRARSTRRRVNEQQTSTMPRDRRARPATFANGGSETASLTPEGSETG
jgi:RNA polymerase subunit RPABC4/transcription elongation factor Spt4